MILTVFFPKLGFVSSLSLVITTITNMYDESAEASKCG